MALPAWLTSRSLDLHQIAAAASGTYVLNFVIQNQQQNNWGAEAVASSVDTFYAGTGAAMSQCQVANSVFTLNSCCTNPVPAGCLADTTLTAVLSATGNLASAFAGAATTDQVTGGIDAGQPVTVALLFPGGVDGYCAIYGYTSPTTGAYIYYVADPNPSRGYSLMNSSLFPSQYFGGASWYWTAMTKA